MLLYIIDLILSAIKMNSVETGNERLATIAMTK